MSLPPQTVSSVTDDAGATPAKPRALPAEERRVNPMNTSNTINATIVILLILLKLE